MIHVLVAANVIATLVVAALGNGNEYPIVAVTRERERALKQPKRQRTRCRDNRDAQCPIQHDVIPVALDVWRLGRKRMLAQTRRTP